MITMRSSLQVLFVPVLQRTLALFVFLVWSLRKVFISLLENRRRQPGKLLDTAVGLSSRNLAKRSSGVQTIGCFKKPLPCCRFFHKLTWLRNLFFVIGVSSGSHYEPGDSEPGVSSSGAQFGATPGACPSPWLADGLQSSCAT